MMNKQWSRVMLGLALFAGASAATSADAVAPPATGGVSTSQAGFAEALDQMLRLRQFAQLQAANGDLKQTQAILHHDVSYSARFGGGYLDLVAGRSAEYSQIVHVDGKESGRWAIDYPYQAAANIDETRFKPGQGWFVAWGKVTLDPVKRDSDDLPMTIVDVSYLQACKAAGCSDLNDPLQVMRAHLGDNNWTPEAARQKYRKLRPGQSIPGDVQ